MEISSDQAINNLIDAQANATQQKIAFAVAAKQLDAQRSTGEAVVKLIEQAVNVQKQLASGRLDVRA